MKILLQVINRDNQQVYKRVDLADDLFSYACERLATEPHIRSARVYREVFYTHKSFAEDFEIPEEGVDLLELLKGTKITEGDFDIFSKQNLPRLYENASAANFYDSHTRNDRLRSVIRTLDQVGENGQLHVSNPQQFKEDLLSILSEVFDEDFEQTDVRELAKDRENTD